MENIKDTIELKDTIYINPDDPRQNALNLLKQIQIEYQGTRKQLENINQVLTEREKQVNQFLQYNQSTLSQYNELSLAQYEIKKSINKIGSVVLSNSICPQNPVRSSHIDIRCLGRFEIHSAKKQIERWQSVKAKAALQYLLIKPREAMLKDTLIEALWPDCSVQAANNNLKTAIHILRQTLGNLLDIGDDASHIIFVQGSYIINPEIELWIDVEQFEKHFTLGRRLEKTGNISASISEYEKAEALYRGDYLEDELYEEWTMLRRESLKDNYLFILSKLADYSLENYDYENCVLYCQKLLQKDPCREDAYRRLIYCYSRSGQKNRALRWYEICQKTLESQLNSSPDQQTVTLYNRLQNGESI